MRVLATLQVSSEAEPHAGPPRCRPLGALPTIGVLVEHGESARRAKRKLQAVLFWMKFAGAKQKMAKAVNEKEQAEAAPPPPASAPNGGHATATAAPNGGRATAAHGANGTSTATTR